MALNKIKDILKKYKQIKPKEKNIRVACISVLSDIFNKTVVSESISVNRNIIYLKIHPTFKHEIYLQKDKIISLINKKLSQEESLIKDIL